MTIDEAIEQLKQSQCAKCPTLFCENCVKEKGKMLAEWLEELKELRLGVNYLCDRNYKQGRKDAIEELVKKFHANFNIKNWNEPYGISLEEIDKIAEQMKEGK